LDIQCHFKANQINNFTNMEVDKTLSLKSNYKIPAIFILLCILISCDKYDLVRTNIHDPESKYFVPSPPQLTTTDPTNVTRQSVESGGNISTDGGATVSVRGVCWSLNHNPTIADTKTDDGQGSGNFISNLTGLTSSTKYYLRAYATNSAGTAYGNEVIFTTSSPMKPILTTTNILSVTVNSAKSGGIITSDEGASVTARGICWNISGNPTISDNITTDGTGTGTFTSNLSGLASYSRYFVRAYATNSAGTAYGDQFSFNTQETDNDGNSYNTVIIGTQIWIVENLKTTKFNDGTTIPVVSDNVVWNSLTTPGCCWYNNDIVNKPVYGALYNWYTVDPVSNGNKNVCPVGWHIPTDAEWTILTDYLGGEATAGNYLKEAGLSHWLNINAGATNGSGFTALPGGGRWAPEGFLYLGSKGDWWSSTQLISLQSNWSREMYTNSAVFRGSSGTTTGFSIRCIRN
jgi:uncharacterized protein (TIGR02145 family)